jgi:hypothetical protein
VSKSHRPVPSFLMMQAARPRMMLIGLQRGVEAAEISLRSILS